jgi:hypothetical protein
MKTRSPRRSCRIAAAAIAALVFLSTATPFMPVVHADVTAYLVNVTVRPGYGFANADAAIAYGDGICAKVGAGRRYGEIVADIKTDFATSDEFQASYLITQAVNELCPEQIWLLRNSAARYRPARP